MTTIESFCVSEHADSLAALLDALAGVERCDIDGTSVIVGRDMNGRLTVYIANCVDEAVVIRT